MVCGQHTTCMPVSAPFRGWNSAHVHPPSHDAKPPMQRRAASGTWKWMPIHSGASSRPACGRWLVHAALSAPWCFVLAACPVHTGPNATSSVWHMDMELMEREPWACGMLVLLCSRKPCSVLHSDAGSPQPHACMAGCLPAAPSPLTPCTSRPHAPADTGATSSKNRCTAATQALRCSACSRHSGARGTGCCCPACKLEPGRTRLHVAPQAFSLAETVIKKRKQKNHREASALHAKI